LSKSRILPSCEFYFTRIESLLRLLRVRSPSSTSFFCKTLSSDKMAILLSCLLFRSVRSWNLVAPISIFDFENSDPHDHIPEFAKTDSAKVIQYSLIDKWFQWDCKRCYENCCFILGIMCCFRSCRFQSATACVLTMMRSWSSHEQPSGLVNIHAHWPFHVASGDPRSFLRRDARFCAFQDVDCSIGSVFQISNGSQRISGPKQIIANRAKIIRSIWRAESTISSSMQIK
jgi:hypothetical protein